MSLLVAVSTFGSANGSLFAGSRTAFATARDGLLPDAFSGVQQSFKTPLPSIMLLVWAHATITWLLMMLFFILQASIASVYVCVGDVGVLIDGLSAVIWVFYLLIFCAVLILRVTHPELPRRFKAGN